MKRLNPILAAALLAFGAPLAQAAPATDGGIPTAQPEAVGVDSARLVALSEWIRRDKLDVRSLLVIKDGKLVFERYSEGLGRDYNHELYSVTKFISALLVGTLVGDGRLAATDTPAPRLAAARPDLASALADKQQIQLRHLMSMSSGLSYKLVEGTDTLYYGVPDRLKVAASASVRTTPGTEFDYIDVNPVLVGATVSQVTGMPEQQYAAKRLFEPLGMSHYRWDGADGKGAVSGGWGLRLRSIDMARLGMLMLNQGRWNGQQIVPASWVAQMTTPSGAASDYGYYCWVNNIVKGEREFSAMGYKGQFITVLPKQNAVIVMNSIMSTQGGLRDAKYLDLYRQMVNDYVLPALQAGATVKPDATRQAALKKELELARTTQGVPGTQLAFNDKPEQ
ncbi:Beta-lactamase class C-like and penicillin binding proteins (PBPs) superfamily [Cupriavidus sp. U2]|uniref:serine hydrolase domain-containing protein n=1 Tax=Cupriavidus sp. U2 TaxID=2920269 RepID=UPI00129EF991|nr:serine hydrolase [Cupriavidus sp. U2]KAI3590756.1 Beta-lactamase class C-like and penicillin binding proteins (PBPs) superfamily [Cupriavidus sp. U2]